MPEIAIFLALFRCCIYCRFSTLKIYIRLEPLILMGFSFYILICRLVFFCFFVKHFDAMLYWLPFSPTFFPYWNVMNPLFPSNLLAYLLYLLCRCIYRIAVFTVSLYLLYRCLHCLFSLYIYTRICFAAIPFLHFMIFWFHYLHLYSILSFSMPRFHQVNLGFFCCFYK